MQLEMRHTQTNKLQLKIYSINRQLPSTLRNTLACRAGGSRRVRAATGLLFWSNRASFPPSNVAVAPHELCFVHELCK